MPTVSSNTVMTPVVAALDRRPALTANPSEVERIFDVALCELVADGVFHEEWWSVPGRLGPSGLPVGEFPVWFFDVAGETVWGATARTLMELVCLVLGVEFPPSLRAQASDAGDPVSGQQVRDADEPPGRAGGEPSVTAPGGIVGSSRMAQCRSGHRSEVWRTATRVRRNVTWLSLRSASSNRVGGPTGSTTSPSFPADGRGIPRTSTSAGRSTPTGSTSRSWPRPWTAWSARPRPSRSAGSAASGVLNLEGLWTRYEDPTPLFDEIRELPAEKATARMQQMYAEPVQLELVTERIREMKAAGITTAASVTPQKTELFAPALLGRRAGPAGHPGHGGLGRARVEDGRAAQPQALHPRVRDPGDRRRAAPRTRPAST